MDHQQAIATQAAERYLLNELGDADRDAFEDHYFTCAACAEDVTAGAQMKDGVRAGLIDTAAASQSAKVVPIESRRRSMTAVFVPWAVAASLALVAGYQALWVMPGLRQDAMGPAVTVPLLLKPASRGTVPTVTPNSGVIAFSLDLNSAAEAGAPLTYDLRTVDGQTVVSGAVTAPPAGTPLLLVIPATRLATPGAYTLMIGGNGNTPVAEYRFAVAKP